MISTQLSLFDTSTDLAGSCYKAGDWVELKGKSKNAAYLKRGDVVQVEAVHPVNGSVKFWNEHTQRGYFLYSEEIKLRVKPVFGEILEPIVESVFGEILEPIVESVFGKVSELKFESVFGEASAKNYWNCNKGYSDNEWLESHYKIRVDGKQRSINCPEIGCTGPDYSYRWIQGKQQRAKYTPTSKCPAVRKSLAMRQPISEILKIISSQ
jgi:hypothetical protein